MLIPRGMVFGDRTWVRIGAAATEATVCVNGQFAGTHLGAWTSFEFEITPLLREQNELEITCVDRIHTTDGFLPVIGLRWTGTRDVELRSVATPIRPPPASAAPPAARSSSWTGVPSGFTECCIGDIMRSWVIPGPPKS